MVHLAVIAPPFASHFRALEYLAVELILRGYRVTFFQQADARQMLSHPRVGFHSLGQTSHPPGSLNKDSDPSNSPFTLLNAFGFARALGRQTDMLCRELPAALASLKVDALLCDQWEAAGGMVSEALGLPFISIACSLPINRGDAVPHPLTARAYGMDDRSLKHYRSSTALLDWLAGPLRRSIAANARRLAISPRNGPHECLSRMAQIGQTVYGLDFPRPELPGCYHEVGPLSPSDALQTELPWPIDPQCPFILTSLGPQHSHRNALLERIARACAVLGVQLLIEHRGKLNTGQCNRLLAQGATWVTAQAPRQATLAAADIVICTPDIDSVMAAVSANTAILAIPIAFDQPAMASRILYNGIGRRVGPKASTREVKAQLALLLEDQPSANMAYLQRNLARAGGVKRAAEVIQSLVPQVRPAPVLVYSAR
jgi:zeaxanthin glucosyltransferase